MDGHLAKNKKSWIISQELSAIVAVKYNACFLSIKPMKRKDMKEIAIQLYTHTLWGFTKKKMENIYKIFNVQKIKFPTKASARIHRNNKKMLEQLL